MDANRGRRKLETQNEIEKKKKIQIKQEIGKQKKKIGWHHNTIISSLIS